MLCYQNPICTADNLIVSIDNIVADFYISEPSARIALMKILEQLPLQYAVDVRNWTSFKIGSFRENFTIAMQDGTSFWLGAALNSRKTEWGRIRLDFNPNKVGEHETFQLLLLYVVQHTRPMHRTLKRFDLAIDIPIVRQDVFLVKDKRVYIERRHGQEWTQYLGPKSSTVGRVKLYNKQIESKLLYPLTRLELTLDPATPYTEIAFPTVYYLDDLQIQMDDLFKITDTENFILNALLQGFGSVDMLGYKTRKKIEMLLSKYVRKIEICEKDYNAVLRQLSRYVSSGIAYDTSLTDQPPQYVPQLPDWVTEIDNEVQVGLDELPRTANGELPF